ncbi:site-specific integrase [Shinella sp. DD12]|uniref:site-specific integrase n=1 Tax=Shinella sp. DD12 TaxID=1410620 RepID=UPI0003C53B21|nr:site-specific integrase [Shinella sp. DD12]EYR80008.1 phage integrase family protein [Shinella sp. DD12]
MADKLTDKIVDGEPAPTSGQTLLWDGELKGFGCRVTAGGKRVFFYNYRTRDGREGRVKIGERDNSRRDTWTTAAARKMALDHAADVRMGGDPARGLRDAKAARKAEAAALTVGDVLDAFLSGHAKVHLKPKTVTEYERVIGKLIVPRIGSVKIAELATPAVARLYQDLLKLPRRGGGSAATQAAAAIRVLSSAMAWAEEAGHRPAGSNPAKIRLKSSRRRERLFSENEVARLLAATEALEREDELSATVALGIRLLFATGCRAGEICGLEWAGVDFERGLLRWSDTKTGTLRKPMTDEAATLLTAARQAVPVGTRQVCPAVRGDGTLRVETLEAGFERVMEAADVTAGENATLHLIRHWFATKTYTDKSIPLPTAMAIVGHKSVATAMRYAHVSDEELTTAAAGAAQRRREAVEAAGKRGQVVPLNGGEA